MSYNDNGLVPGHDVHVYNSGGGGGRLAILCGVILIVALIVMGAAGIRSFGPEARARAEVIARTPAPTPTPHPDVVAAQNQTEINLQVAARIGAWIGVGCFGLLGIAFVVSWSWRRC